MAKQKSQPAVEQPAAAPSAYQDKFDDVVEIVTVGLAMKERVYLNTLLAGGYRLLSVASETWWREETSHVQGGFVFRKTCLVLGRPRDVEPISRKQATQETDDAAD